MKAYFGKTLGVIHWCEDATLVVSFLTLLFLGVMQIVLRNFFEAGVFWAESFLRILILWVALLGAMIATRERNHINIDAISRFFPDTSRKLVNSLVAALSAGVCATVAWYSFQFVRLEYEDNFMAFASVPTWATEVIIPFAFLVMAVRFFIQIFSAWIEPKQ